VEHLGNEVRTYKNTMGTTKTQHVPNHSSLYPISFALSSTLGNLYIQPPKGGYYNISILGLSKA
jgi:hypothetical protein